MIPLLVLRHAPTEWNRTGRLQGRADIPLGAFGRECAKSWRLPAGWEGRHCLASPLRRAMETAFLLGLDPAPEPALIEMDWGEWEGRTIAALRAELGGDMAENERRGLDFRPPGGESPREVQVRVAALFASLSEPTIVVTHKGVLRATYALASGWAMAEKPGVKLADHCAHLFMAAPGGALSVKRLNVPLRPSA